MAGPVVYHAANAASRGSELAFRDHGARVQFFVLAALIAIMACLLYMRLVELLALPDRDDTPDS